MSEKETGGAAFPSTNEVKVGDWMIGGHQGMTLRDYFAAKAMQGWISNSPLIKGEKLNDSEEHCETVAKSAYFYADAMLKARNE